MEPRKGTKDGDVIHFVYQETENIRRGALQRLVKLPQQTKRRDAAVSSTEELQIRIYCPNTPLKV